MSSKFLESSPRLRSLVQHPSAVGSLVVAEHSATDLAVSQPNQTPQYFPDIWNTRQGNYVLLNAL